MARKKNPCQKKKLISYHIKGPLVAAFRSSLLKALYRQEFRNVGSMNCNFFCYIH